VLLTTGQRSVESPKTKIFDVALRVSLHLRLPKAAAYFDRRHYESRSHDFVVAADSGELVKKVDFAKAGANYYAIQHVLFYVWAPTSGVQILYGHASPQGLSY
jgi:hypothetical protein